MIVIEVLLIFFLFRFFFQLLNFNSVVNNLNDAIHVITVYFPSFFGTKQFVIFGNSSGFVATVFFLIISDKFLNAGFHFRTHKPQNFMWFITAGYIFKKR